MREPDVGESGISEDESVPDVFEDGDYDPPSDDEYGTDQGFQPCFPTPRGAERRRGIHRRARQGVRST